MATASKISLKLLIDTQGNRVLFAEAGKDFVDFLIFIFSLPVGTIINLLKKQQMMGSLGNLYQSIENLKDSYLQPNQTKETFLKPVPPTSGFVPLLTLKGGPSTGKRFYRCNYSTTCGSYVSDNSNANCPYCNGKMTLVMSYVAPPAAQQGSDEGGFVKGVVTYMVMDDLAVMPLSSISSIILLSKFGIKDVSVLKEKVVDLGMDEKCTLKLGREGAVCKAVEILNTSLNSKEVLTNVFLKDIKQNL